MNNNEFTVSSNTKIILKIGEWQVFPWQNCLIKDEKTKSIEPQCMALLIFLAEHQGQVISRIELLDKLWKNVVVNENTLTKTVGMLRLALEDDAKEPQYIVTRIKKGYQLIAAVQELGKDEFDSPQSLMTKPEVTQQSINQQTNKVVTAKLAPRVPVTNNKLSLIKIVAVILSFIFLALLALMFWQEQTNKEVSYSKFSPVTFGAGIERDPNFSPDGQFLIYSKRKNQSSNFNLSIYSLKQQISMVISNFIGDELAPAFSPDGSKIAYFHKDEDICHLYVSQFTYPNTITKGQKVANCGYNNQGKIYWLDDDQLLFSDRDIETMGEHKLYRLELSSLYRKEIKGHYPFAFSVSPNKQTIALLERHHGRFDLDINEFSLLQKTSSSWLSGLTHFSEFAWLNDEKRLLITDTLYGSISIAEKNGYKQNIYQANMMFSQPVVNPINGLIALVQSSIKSNIYQISNPIIQTKNKPVIDSLAMSNPLLASNYFDYLHQYSRDIQLSAFISNRNGKHQLWISTKGTERPVTHEYLSSGDIIDFRWSPDASKILVMLNNSKVFIYTLKDNSVFKLPLGKDEDQIYYPVWDSQGNGILFAKMSEMGPKISHYDINTGTEQKITNTGAMTVSASPDGRYFYLLKLKSGLWQLDRVSGKEQLLLANVTPSAWGSVVAFNDGVYWQDSTKIGYQIRHFKLSTAQTSTLMTVPQDNNLPLRYFDVSKDQEKISFHRMYDYQSDLVFLSKP
ncbi:MAG: PD40 domain-containing protein [Colwellia sp.]|nr:PD40 domain-containing protein [Colwellia sp.]